MTETRILTGIKPTGSPHLGNYLGAIRPALELAGQPNHRSFLFIADLHAATTTRNAEHLRHDTLAVAAAWLAFGLDPEKTVFYRQSDIPEIPALAWLLSCVTPMGFLNRSHSYKDATAKGLKAEDINHGVFAYPVLMAADILLFDADVVPVGKDQKQHLEITQEIARKLNFVYGDVLKVPEARIDDQVMTIPGIDGQKMSKSHGNTIDVLLEEAALKKVVRQITTNSTPFGDPLMWEGETVFSLYRQLANKAQLDRLRGAYASGRKDPAAGDAEENFFGWGHAKSELFELLRDRFREARARFAELTAHPESIESVLEQGRETARAIARPVYDRVRGAVGLTGRLW
jgi:tryptophanyl-tRNA synthetase